MTPSGLSHLAEEDRVESLIVYFNIQEEMRRRRLMQRNDGNDKVERRLAADEKDFEGFTDYDIQEVNPLFNEVILVSNISQIV